MSPDNRYFLFFVSLLYAGVVVVYMKNAYELLCDAVRTHRSEVATPTYCLAFMVLLLFGSAYIFRTYLALYPLAVSVVAILVFDSTVLSRHAQEFLAETLAQDRATLATLADEVTKVAATFDALAPTRSFKGQTRELIGSTRIRLLKAQLLIGAGREMFERLDTQPALRDRWFPWPEYPDFVREFWFVHTLRFRVEPYLSKANCLRSSIVGPVKTRVAWEHLPLLHRKQSSQKLRTSLPCLKLPQKSLGEIFSSVRTTLRDAEQAVEQLTLANARVSGGLGGEEDGLQTLESICMLFTTSLPDGHCSKLVEAMNKTLETFQTTLTRVRDSLTSDPIYASGELYTYLQSVLFVAEIVKLQLSFSVELLPRALACKQRVAALGKDAPSVDRAEDKVVRCFVDALPFPLASPFRFDVTHGRCLTQERQVLAAFAARTEMLVDLVDHRLPEIRAAIAALDAQLAGDCGLDDMTVDSAAVSRMLEDLRAAERTALNAIHNGNLRLARMVLELLPKPAAPTPVAEAA